QATTPPSCCYESREELALFRNSCLGSGDLALNFLDSLVTIFIIGVRNDRFRDSRLFLVRFGLRFCLNHYLVASFQRLFPSLHLGLGTGGHARARNRLLLASLAF